jgi:DNA-binding transcriptional ArsR family regulator
MEEELKNKKTIASRGIPSSKALYLPAYNSKELRKFEDDNESLTRNLWTLEEVLNFIFPKEIQERYNETALLFLKELIQKVEMNGEMTGNFISQNNLSKATFYNKVLIKLKKAGLVKIERESITNKETKRKYRPMVISLSKTFGNYLTKIADSWLAIVEDARYNKKKKEE